MPRHIILTAILFLSIAAGCQPESPQAIVTSPAAKSAAPLLMETKTLGQSVEGRPIVMHRFGTGNVVTLIIGGIHGDETSAYKLAAKFAELLKTGGDVGMDGAVAIIPIANPDGVAAGRRTNAHQVDINRNFAAGNWAKTRKGSYHGGPSALSEPESRILDAAVMSLKPQRIISIHSIGGGRECNNFDGPGEWLAQRMATQNGYPVRDTIGYPTPGSFGSWAGGDLKIPVITLELPGRMPAEQAWEINRGALLAAIRKK